MKNKKNRKNINDEALKKNAAFLEKENNEQDIKPSLSQTFVNKKNISKTKQNRRQNFKKLKVKGRSERDKTSLPIFFNRIKIRIEGFNQNRLIAVFLKEGIRLYEINKKSQKLMDVVIDYKFKQKAIAIIQNLCYTHSIIDVSGLKPISKWLAGRIGLLIGTIVFAIIAAISGTYIWKIDISGNDKVDRLTIMRELSDINVCVGKSKQFDSFKVSQAVSGIEGIAECTIEVIGTTVKVSVIESKDYIKPDNDTTIGDIVSIYDAEITRVIVSGGTALVGIGDRIPSGSILISKDVLDTNGEVIRETKAKGSIYGKVYFSDTTIISTTVQELVRTGKKNRYTTIGLFGLKIGKKPRLDFSYFQSVNTKSYAFYNTFLPITAEQTTHYEMKENLVEREIDELIDEYKRDKLLSIIINAGGSEIKTTIVKQELAKGLYSVQLYLEAEMLISEFRESQPIAVGN